MKDLARMVSRMLTGTQGTFHTTSAAIELARNLHVNTSQAAVIAGVAAGHVASTINGLAIEAGAVGASAARDAGSSPAVPDRQWRSL